MRGPGEPPLIPPCISITHQSCIWIILLALAAGHSPGFELWQFNMLLLTFADLALYEMKLAQSRDGWLSKENITAN